MLRYLVRRLVLLAVTLLLASVVVFGLTQLLPGDVPRLILGREARPEAVAELRVQLGLDRPVAEQYTRWLGQFAGGDWGRSFTSGRPAIRPLVLERLGNSLRLAALTLAVSVPLAVALGVLAGLYADTWVDTLISVVSLSVVGLPEFVTGLVLINTLALGLGWFPPTATVPFSAPLAEWLPQLVLPAITASLVLIGYIVRMTRAGVVDELARPYVRTAILKGLSTRQVIVKHVLRNALLPTITVVALSFGWMIGGLVIIEFVFNYPGLGRLLVAAVERKDIPLMQAIVMVTIAAYALANLAADLLYTLLNPRIRLE